MNDKKCVKLDLYIDDEEVLHQNNDEESADEVLCLRILSSKTKYRFGGLKVHIESPVFDVGKIFNVEFDEDSEVALIKSQKDYPPGVELPHTPTSSKAATIVISPDRDDIALTNASKVSADLTLLELSTDPIAADSELKDEAIAAGGENGAGGRRMSTQLKKFVSKKWQNSYNNVSRVKRFFSDSMQFWN